MSVLIGGGSGFIGSVLSRALTNKGYNVIVVSRYPGLNRMTWTDLEGSGLPRECKAVVNLAGQNIMDPTRRWTPGFKQNIWASRINSTKSLAKAIRLSKIKPKVFATISGVAYYKPSPTETYTENSSGGDFDYLSRLCTDWEAAAALPRDINVRRVSIRTGAVLGRQGGMIKNLIWPFFLGLGGPIASGTQWLPWIHVNDLASLFVHAIENERVSGIVNGVAPQAITNAEFAKSFAHQMWRPALIPLPLTIANLAFGKERATMLTEGQKVYPEKALQSGFQYEFPDIKSACEEFAQLIYHDLPEEMR